MITGYQGYLNPDLSVTIDISTQLSSEIVTGGFQLCGFILPAAFTGTAITFQVSNTSGGTYVDLYNSAGQVSYTVAPSRYVAVDPKDFQGVKYLKLKSGSSEAAARTIICSMKGI